MKIVIIGHGRMGHMIEEQILASSDMEIMSIIDVENVGELESLPKADAAIEFAAPSISSLTYGYIKRTGTPLVCGTTGYTSEQISSLKELGAYAPIVYSANYSLGVAVMKKVAHDMAEALSGFDIEITETHHNKKADAPSGTAKLLLESIDPNHEHTPIYGREGICGARDAKEIGVHAIRGGTVAGVHTVSFFGEDEELSLTHRATSRAIFASGALKIARILAGRPNGFYTIDELLF